MDNNHIYEPVNEYDKKYRDLHKKNVEEYFEDLVKKSGVNTEENVVTVKEVKRLSKLVKAESEKIKKFKRIKMALIIGIIITFIASFVMVFRMTRPDYSGNLGVEIVVTILLLGLGIGFIFLIFKKINVIIKESERISAELKSKLREEIQKGFNQMRPLNDLFDWGMPAELVQKTLPMLVMDPYFNPKRYDVLYNKYGLMDNSPIDTSVTFVQSGEIKGNPFVLGKMVNHQMVDYPYRGSKTISWTERVSDGKGGYRTVTRTQTLYATLMKPKPAYFRKSFLMYGNEAAPDLSFSRTSANVDDLSEKERNRKLARGKKKLEKKARKSVHKGGSFTALTNSDFDVLFGATNRDNEVQYRLLYTPLAQKETLNIILDNKVGFGDDFDFIKKKMMNIIIPKHLEQTDINTNPKRYIHYDLEEIRRIFNDYNNLYFKSVFFSFAPLFAIPLYQQHKPKEYIYKSKYNSNVCSWEHEAIANGFSQGILKHPLSATFNMIKTRLISSRKGADEVRITAHGYEEFREVEYVPVRGGDGFMHDVPVVWYRYEPVSQDTDIVIKTADTLKRNEYIKDVMNNADWQAYLDKNLSAGKEVLYRRNIIAYTSHKDAGLASIDDLKKILDR
ncbi:MAG TPA: hypothetical protein GXX71_01055 [Acholeplasma sp.]|jgi:hypothetical protein|nr:hypothetical protein [Acholeplasma sp.]